MRNALKEKKKNRQKQEKDIEKTVGTMKRINLLTSSGVWMVRFHGTVHAAFKQSVKFLRAIWHVGQSCSLVHSAPQGQKWFIDIPNSRSILLCNSHWQEALEFVCWGCSFSFISFFFLLWMDGRFDTKLMTLWYSTLIVILPNHKHTHLNYTENINLERKYLIFIK